MSARGHVGASSRAELFVSARSKEDESKSNIRSQGPSGANFGEQEFKDDDQGPLQVEHMMGYGGNYRQTVLASVSNENILIKSLGALVCVENLLDPHDQKLLRGHDMPVSSLCLAPSGRFIASGQEGTRTFKGYAAPIFIWQPTVSGAYRRVMSLKGLTVRINLMSISADERFLCACGEDQFLCVWDLGSGEVVYCQKLPTPATVMQWIGYKKEKHYPTYEVVLGHGSQLMSCQFLFQQDKVQWGLRSKVFTMPPGGSIVRTFTCMDTSVERDFVFVGTTGGEMFVFRKDTEVFRACIPVCSNGVQSILTLPDGSVLLGGGDGTVTKLAGADMEWRASMRVRFDSSINSLSLSCNNSEFLAGCADGTVYRGLVRNLANNIVNESHTSAISSIAFSSDKQREADAEAMARSGSSSARPDSLIFATGTKSGEIRLWDLADYACVAVCRYPKSGEVNCMTILTNDRLISGWTDGMIRCNDLNNLQQQMWFIPAAHRGGTTSLCAQGGSSSSLGSEAQFLVSGGTDGCVRVWRLSNRELICQYNDHSKLVSQVLVDVQRPHIIHSVGADCSVVSYDVKASRRIICHLLSSGGSMTGMSQRKDSEQELVTCDTQGRLLQWDIDVREPVRALQDPSRSCLHCCQVSPTGRFLAFAGEDQLVKVLDLVEGDIVAVSQGHSGSVRALHWTPDERQIVSGGDDTSLIIWNFYLGGV